MPRHAHEFQCAHNCGYWNYPMLSDKMDGNYTIKCGNCGHEHHRYIKSGVVTDDRCNDKAGHVDTIHVPKSATSKEKRQLGIIAQFRQKEAAGLAR